MENLGIYVAIIALLITLWQAFVSKQQLEHARETKSDTEKLLEDIKGKVHRIETISDETRKDVKEQISKLIDKQDENMKTLLNSPAKSEENQMMMQILGPMLQNPDMFEKLVELGNKEK